MSKKVTMETMLSLLKRRGFIFPGSDIYGGLANSWDYGPLGVELKNNIKNLWWDRFVRQRKDVVGIDAALIMNPKVWEASEHVSNFHDPLVECKKCHKRFREDHLEGKKTCPDCKGELTAPTQFNMMFKTFLGPSEDSAGQVYLRPETAQAMFVDFPHVVDTTRAKVPFGIAQIGKAFRNEITTGNFIFRTREFEQMEIEYFVEEKEWEKHFDNWLKEMKTWLKDIGVKDKNLHYVDIPEDERAHYSKKTIDIEYDYPFGQKELYGLAYRTDFDLSQHQKHSGKDMSYRDPVSGKTYIPHVIEPTFGVDRTVLTVLLEAYEEIKGGRSTTKEAVKESEIVLRLPKALAPVKAAILPLSKKEPLQKLSDEIFNKISSVGNVQYDETGSIGKRYRRQDEIGTPYCITIDFDSLEDNSVTVRDRDTMEQERIKVEDLNNYLSEKFAS